MFRIFIYQNLVKKTYVLYHTESMTNQNEVLISRSDLLRKLKISKSDTSSEFHRVSPNKKRIFTLNFFKCEYTDGLFQVGKISLDNQSFFPRPMNIEWPAESSEIISVTERQPLFEGGNYQLFVELEGRVRGEKDILNKYIYHENENGQKREAGEKSGTMYSTINSITRQRITDIPMETKLPEFIDVRKTAIALIKQLTVNNFDKPQIVLP